MEKKNLQIRLFFFIFWHFNHPFPVQYSKMCITTRWWKPSYTSHLCSSVPSLSHGCRSNSISLPSSLIFHFSFVANLLSFQLFFFPIKFSFQAAPPLKPLLPITRTGFSLMHHSWFCSLMHSISLSSLPSQPHHQIFIIGFYVVLQPPPFLSRRGFSCCLLLLAPF